MQKAQIDLPQHYANGMKSAGDIPEVENSNVSVRDSMASGVPTLVASSKAEGEADDDASTKGMASPASDARIGATQSDLNISQIPTIKISSESDREDEDVEADVPTNDKTPAATENGASQHITHELEKPSQAAAADEKDGSGEGSANPVQEGFSFSNKRLCERWLDNLFMVLYEVQGYITCSALPLLT